MEYEEYFLVTLNSTSSGVVLQNENVSVVIADDDCKPCIVYYHLFKNTVYIITPLSDATFSLQKQLYEVEEEEILYICVELKSCLQENITVNLTFLSDTAQGDY